MSSESEGSSLPDLPVESAGSSVSSSLQKEYEELLRYAVVTPKVIIPPQAAEKVNKMPQYSFTSTETTSESYESEVKDIPKEVSGLPTTPVLTRKVPELQQHQERSEEITESEGMVCVARLSTLKAMSQGSIINIMTLLTRTI